MPKTRVNFTYADYLQLPEDKRYELVEGEFYMLPSPNIYHQSPIGEAMTAAESKKRKVLIF